MDNQQLVELTSDIVSAHLSSNKVNADQIPGLVQQVHQALASLGHVEEAPAAKEPAVSIRASVKPDYLVCLECGSKQKALKRHIGSAHGLTPNQYRADYGLSPDYPMTSSVTSDRRSEIAKGNDFGRKKGEKVVNRSRLKLKLGNGGDE